jgi:hypothetical protein
MLGGSPDRIEACNSALLPLTATLSPEPANKEPGKDNILGLNLSTSGEDSFVTDGNQLDATLDHLDDSSAPLSPVHQQDSPKRWAHHTLPRPLATITTTQLNRRSPSPLPPAEFHKL